MMFMDDLFEEFDNMRSDTINNLTNELTDELNKRVHDVETDAKEVDRIVNKYVGLIMDSIGSDDIINVVFNNNIEDEEESKFSEDDEDEDEEDFSYYEEYDEKGPEYSYQEEEEDPEEEFKEEIRSRVSDEEKDYILELANKVANYYKYIPGVQCVYINTVYYSPKSIETSIGIVCDDESVIYERAPHSYDGLALIVDEKGLYAPTIRKETIWGNSKHNYLTIYNDSRVRLEIINTKDLERKLEEPWCGIFRFEGITFGKIVYDKTGNKYSELGKYVYENFRDQFYDEDHKLYPKYINLFPEEKPTRGRVR